MDPATIPQYTEWHTSEKEYVMCARRAAKLRGLEKVLVPNLSNVQMFAERDPQTMKVE
jgi:hypothetical protein